MNVVRKKPEYLEEKINYSELYTKEDHDRAKVRSYSFIPRFIFRLLPNNLLKSMYKKAHNEAIGEYLTPPMTAMSSDFRSIARSTVNLEYEMQRRGLEIDSLEPDNNRPKVYATKIWTKYLER